MLAPRLVPPCLMMSVALSNTSMKETGPLAAPIVDGEHIHVYALGEPKLSSQSSEETPEVVLDKDNPININTASISELDQLPGIGETRAQDIIIYRDIHGPFEKIEDLMNVPGIGESTFNNIKDYITIQTTTP